MKNEKQLLLLRKARELYSKFEDKKFKNNLPSVYLNPNSNLSLFFLNLLLDRNLSFIKSFTVVVKDIFYSLRYINYKIFIPLHIADHDKIIVTWAFKKDFTKNGSFKDRYFKINSNNLKKTLWIVIYMDKEKPLKFKDNIILFQPYQSNSFNFLPIIRFIIANSLILFKSPKLFLFSISSNSFFSYIFLKNIRKFLNKNIHQIIMPYEGQPFQNELVKFIKKKFRHIKTIGYVHSPPMGLPANFIFNKYSPTKLILSGKDQVNCFIKYLGWKKKRIIFLPSFRFSKLKTNLKNMIYLPIAMHNVKKISKRLKHLYFNNIVEVKKYKLKSHPAVISSKKNRIDIDKLKSTLKKLNTKKSRFLYKNPSIFVGTSGAIIEALERGSKVIQICDDPLFDIYSEKLWPSIKKKKIDDDIFSYELRKKENLIKFGLKTSNKSNLIRIGKT
tara:strand:- start:2825 stop:4156 length:1332 start_codon:yes stop_codon:yes gene_type:complete